MSEHRAGDHAFADLAAEYALGGLPEAEREAFEAHLSDCSDCASAVAENARIVGMLGAAVDPVAPPAALRDRVLAAARQSRPDSRQPGGSFSATQPSRGSHPPGATTRPVTVARAWPWLAAAATLVLAAGLGWTLRSERSARGIAERELAASRTRLAASEALLETVLSPQVETTLLTAADRAPSVRLYWNRQRATLVLAAAGLPPAASGRTYQLWGIAADQAPHSLGTFNTAADGAARIVVAVPAGAVFDVSAVTEEPAGGSPQPTSSPFLVGNWGQSG